MIHHFRIGDFGAARHPKTLIVFEDTERYENWWPSPKQNLMPQVVQEVGVYEAEAWLCALDQQTSEKKRSEMLEEWIKPDGRLRILVTDQSEDLHLIVPDVQTLAVVALHRPEQRVPRWQRMCRMA